jgi:putative SOS response-associated peptidase YedK
MCSRFVLTTSPQAIAKQFQVEKTVDWKPRYNVAPSQPVPAVVRTLEHRKREMKLLRWGFFAPWTQGGRLLVNYRGEDIDEKPILRESFEKWRCLIPADGFYEWRHAARETRPHHFSLKIKKPLAFAGIWSPQTTREGTVEACAILTTTPNEVVRPVHDRMPVILEERDYGRWLDGEVRDFKDLLGLLKPFPANKLECRRVGAWVNNARHDDARCLEPSDEPGTLDLPY